MSDCETGPSYREKLRAGGRGAFQRAFDIGLMPKTMKQPMTQEWGTAQAQPSLDLQGMLSQQDVQSGMMMPCMTGGDAQQMWTGTTQMQGNEYWYVPVEQPHMQAPCAYTQQVPMMQPPQPLELLQMSQQPVLPMPAQGMMQPQDMMQATPDSTPTEFQRCMAIVMPQSADLARDNALMAAQLQAVADCQCYED